MMTSNRGHKHKRLRRQKRSDRSLVGLRNLRSQNLQHRPKNVPPRFHPDAHSQRGLFRVATLHVEVTPELLDCPGPASACAAVRHRAIVPGRRREEQIQGEPEALAYSYARGWPLCHLKDAHPGKLHRQTREELPYSSIIPIARTGAAVVPSHLIGNTESLK